MVDLSLQLYRVSKLTFCVVFYFFLGRGLVVVLVFGEDDVGIKEGLKEGEDLGGGGGHVIACYCDDDWLFLWGWWIIFLFLYYSVLFLEFARKPVKNRQLNLNSTY